MNPLFENLRLFKPLKIHYLNSFKIFWKNLESIFESAVGFNGWSERLDNFPNFSFVMVDSKTREGIF